MIVSSTSQPTTPDFQLSISEQGKLVTSVDHFQQLVRILLTTEPGTDIMRPDFGIGVVSMVGKPIQDVTAEMRRRGRQQFRDYIPEIKITSYTANYDDAGTGVLTVTVFWQYANTSTSTTITA